MNSLCRRVLGASLLAIVAVGSAHATNHLVRINEVLAGLNGDSNIQFIEILVSDDGQKSWGPQNGEAAGRAMLEFTNAEGIATGRFVFPKNPAAGARNVLIATSAFAALTGAPRVDFIMPALMPANSGKLCFKGNPDNSNAFVVTQCISYGKFTGADDGEGTPITSGLPIMGAATLRRIANFDPSSEPLGNEDFAAGSPTPASTTSSIDTATEQNLNGGGSAAFTVLSSAEQGRNLFFKETFSGNGRTCATCHVPPTFGMSPTDVSAKATDDPLFIADAEQDINRLVVQTSGTTTGRAQPSDLVGTVSDTIGNQGRILGFFGNGYLVVGGKKLTGLIKDNSGNSATVVSVTNGTLSQANFVNGSPNGLEDQVGNRLRVSKSTAFPKGRALVLENIDGFTQLEVMRGSPHIANAKFTAPFGWGGDIPDLKAFSLGAVKQHFPRSIQRRDGIDFRLPTDAELAAMEAFQLSITLPADNNFDLDTYTTTAAQKRGRDLFFGAAKCGQCHTGAALGGQQGTFDTGVANLSINQLDNLPSEPAGRGFGNSTRLFDVPSLFGAIKNAPYFHDHSVATLDDAVAFYDTPAFINSPAGKTIGTIPAASLLSARSDIVAFLSALQDLPLSFPRSIDFGLVTAPKQTKASQTAILSNRGKTTVTIMAMALTGDKDQFVAPIELIGRTLNPSSLFSFAIDYIPTTSSSHAAILELRVQDQTDTWNIGIALSGNALKDDVPPTITAPADQSIEATGPTMAIALGTATVADNLAVASVTNNAPTSFPVGITVITWTAKDAAGNVATAQQTITIRDTTAPVLGSPADLTVDATAVLTPVTLKAPTASDAVGVDSLRNDAPVAFALGTTTVTWTATDEAGNSSTVTQRITAKDSVAPTLAIPSDMIVEATAVSSTIDIGTATGKDNIQLASVTNNAPTGFPVGTTAVTWQAKDLAGNVTSAQQRITVFDNKKPTLAVPPPVQAEASGLFTPITVGAATASDATGITTLFNNAPDKFPLGRTVVVWFAVDGSNNLSIAEQSVTIVDTQGPIISVPSDKTVEATGTLTAVTIGQANAHDAIGVQTTSNDGPQEFPVGETIVKWTATDLSGNTAQQTQRIVVRDTTAPTLVLPPDVAVESATAMENLAIGQANATDLVGVTTIANDAPTIFPLGETKVTWTAIDAANNKATQIQTITITTPGTAPTGKKPQVVEPEPASNSDSSGGGSLDGVWLALLMLLWTRIAAQQRTSLRA